MTRLHLDRTTLRAVAVCLLVFLAASRSSLAQQQWERIGDGLSTPRGVIYDSTVTSVAVDSIGTIFATLPRYVIIENQYINVGGPLYRSTDDGASWVKLRESVAAVQLAPSGALFADISHTRLSNTTVVYQPRTELSTDGGITWSVLLSTHQWARSLSGYGPYLVASSDTVKVSTDGGRTWTARAFDSSRSLLRAGITPSGSILAIASPSAGSMRPQLVRSSDTGSTWAVVFDSLPHYDLFMLRDGTAFVPASFGVGSSELGLNRSTDGGATWMWSPVPGLPYEIDEPYEGVLLAVQWSGSHWTSTDNGGSWIPRGDSRQRVSTNRAGHLIGVRWIDWALERSADTGRTWTDISQGIERRSLFYIHGHVESPAGYHLVATSTGLWRSVGVLGVEDPDEQDHALALRVLPQPVRDQAIISVALRNPADVAITLHDASGRLIRSVEAGQLAAGLHQLDVDTRGLPAGMYVMRCEASSRAVTHSIIVSR